MPAKRCPMCHRASETTAPMCSCGYAFGQDIDTVRRLLRRQLRTSWFKLAGFALLVFGTFALAFTGEPLVSAIGMTMSIGATGRTMRTIAISRESLRQLAPRELPQARLLS